MHCLFYEINFCPINILTLTGPIHEMNKSIYPNLGVYDEKVADFVKCHSSKTSDNYSRAMHRLIHRKDKTLPVQIGSVQVKVKIPRRRKVVLSPWPIIPLSNWMRVCFEDAKYSGFFFLAGHKLDSWAAAQDGFRTFWERYCKLDKHVQVDHPESTIPIYLHGDEGRGLGKRPLLVVSFQPVMSWLGPDYIPSSKHFGLNQFLSTVQSVCFHGALEMMEVVYLAYPQNSQNIFFLPCCCYRHTFTSRLVYTVMPSECSTKRTLDMLLENLVSDLKTLEQEGIKAD